MNITNITISISQLRPTWQRLAIALCMGMGICVSALTAAWAGEVTNRIGITMVSIPAGSFLMGSCKLTSSMVEENKKRAFLDQAPLSADCSGGDPEANDNESSPHRVQISAFQMGKTEVTLGQFKQFIVAMNRFDLVTNDFMKYNRFGDMAPVVQVSWNDAQDFITWLNQTDGKGYRLPSEAEWEYACRAGTQDRYCGGTQVGEVAWYEGNSNEQLHAVAAKQPNAFGLHDMSGNAWEWVQDWYHDSYRGAPTNGSAWVNGGEQKFRVLRGGSWENTARGTRATDRDFSAPDDRHNVDGGFRLARTR